VSVAIGGSAPEVVNGSDLSSAPFANDITPSGNPDVSNTCGYCGSSANARLEVIERSRSPIRFQALVCRFASNTV